ncbi:MULTISPECIES: hypothetical protein [unclassified Caballeronia]|uniref:hypothetical protein n=1 Tax=unclassified Caballeronia TaxID=2646786 RepID=UPI0028545A0E|nr:MULTISPECIES: hypothetical protein [unclassified Caballeronia]MDR5819404.1 hypothetical protein [Caballeronia sp. LZ043]MDR5877172.1 hypothetical protein [Caballeronia sp. LZ032]
MSPTKFCIGAAVAATFMVAAQAFAQSNAAGPIPTPAGTLHFLQDESGMAALIDTQVFDRYDAKRIVHFDDTPGAGVTVARMLVQTDTGPILYDLRRNPPLVQRTGQRMTVKRVFWQGEEVVMQSNLGWYGFTRGKLTQLQSSTRIYH